MKSKSSKSLTSIRGALCVATALVFVLGATRQASANWRSVDAQNAWASYVSHFVKLEPDGYSKVFVTTQGGSTMEDFWRQAEEIEVAEDAYFENPTTANKNLVQGLCDGFVNYMTWNGVKVGDDWSSDPYDDDLMWATIAFARAYNITGTGRWLTDAENNFNTVYNRGHDTTYGGGIWWNYTIKSGGSSANKAAVSNFTFVIAGRLIDNYNGHAGNYKALADSIYGWAVSRLVDPSTGRVANDIEGSGNGQADWNDITYNFGIAIGAANEESDSTLIKNASNYVFNDFTNYDGTYGGYNVLPDYGQGNGNNDGFNGILMRWIGVANSHGLISSAVLAAAQANINAAWSFRNCCTTLVWNDWDLATPSSTYSWDDSAAMAGLLDIPPTA